MARFIRGDVLTQNLNSVLYFHPWCISFLPQAERGIAMNAEW